MNSSIISVTFAVLIISPTSVLAQVALPVYQQQAEGSFLRQGTAVEIVSEQLLSSKSARTGDRFPLRVAEDVKVNGYTVIPAGARGIGEVTMVDKKGMFGKSGKIATRVLYVNVGNHRIGLAGQADDAGSGGTAGVVAAAILFWPVAPFVTGRSANLPPGTRMTGWVENDIPVAVPSTPVPMVLGAAGASSSAPLPTAAAAGGGVVLAAVGEGPPRRAARTASGFCYEVPREYMGAGTLSRPALTSATPACWQLLER